jgi:hypothetical protein
MNRFRKLFITHIFGSRLGTIEEFLQVIKENFFSSLEGHPFKLERLDAMKWSDLDHIQIDILGLYSSKPTKFVLVLDKNFKVKNLFVF